MATYSCEQMQERVYEYLHKELDLETRNDFKEHLKACNQCLSFYSTEAQTSSFVVSSTWRESTEEVIQRVKLRIESEAEN